MTSKKEDSQDNQKITKKKKKKRDTTDYSSLSLRWEEELSFYAAENRYKIYKEKLPSGSFDYRVLDKYGNLILSIESARNVVFGPRRSKRRRNKRRR